MWEQFDWLHAIERSGKLPGQLASAGTSGSADSDPRKLRVLIVDDEKRIADTLCEILENAGFEAHAAYDGWSALESAARFSPDYLLSDVLMPKMNGVELAIAIRSVSPAIKIVLFSGQVGISEILEDGKKRGLQFELIAKPIHPVRLMEELAKL